MDDYAISILTVLICPTIPILVILGAFIAILVRAIGKKEQGTIIATPTLGIISAASSQSVICYLSYHQLVGGKENADQLYVLFSCYTSATYFFVMCFLAVLIMELSVESGMGRFMLVYFGVLICSGIALFKAMLYLGEQQSQWIGFAIYEGTTLDWSVLWPKFLGLSIPSVVLLLTLIIMKTARDDRGRAAHVPLLACGFAAMTIFGACLIGSFLFHATQAVESETIQQDDQNQVRRPVSGPLAVFLIIVMGIYVVGVLPCQVMRVAKRRWQRRVIDSGRVPLLYEGCKEYGSV